MKKKILSCLMVVVICLGIVGCGKKQNVVTVDELNTINDKIITYFTSDNAEYDNLSFNYIDTTNNVIVVGLKDNSKEQQNKFKKLVIDSEYIEFVHGEKLVDYNKN